MAKVSALSHNPAPNAMLMKPEVKQRLCQELRVFFAQQMALGGDIKVKIVDDLILLRCKAALSPSEIEIGTMKSGRRLVQEVCEKTSRELQPALNRILNKVTRLDLLEVNVAIFWRRKEKVFLLTMSDNLGNVETQLGERV